MSDTLYLFRCDRCQKDAFSQENHVLCNGCGQAWTHTETRPREQAFDLARETMARIEQAIRPLLASDQGVTIVVDDGFEPHVLSSEQDPAGIVLVLRAAAEAVDSLVQAETSGQVN